MALDGNQPGRVSPYASPQCPAVYSGVMIPDGETLRCVRIEHPGKRWEDLVHRATLDPLEGSDEPRVVSWL